MATFYIYFISVKRKCTKKSDNTISKNNITNKEEDI